jgi:predicted AlkP superfamily pyrophosphatase or phosphodiesterase
MLFSCLKRGSILVAILVATGATLLSGIARGAPVEHVIIISIDGLRPDAISATRMPNLQRLIQRGVHASNAQTVRPSLTIPAHVSMLTGLDSNRHKVTRETVGRGYYGQPTVHSIAKAAGLTTAMFFSKEKLDFLANPDNLDFIYGPQRHRKISVDTSANAIADAFDTAWSSNKYALTFIHLRELDGAGHWWGWMSKAYLSAATKADRAVGRILATVADSGVEEKIAVLVTADHGGHGRSHREIRPEIMTIPWVVVGPGTPAGIAIEKNIHIYDTAPTVLALLGLSAPTNLDGHVIEEVRADTKGRLSTFILMRRWPFL